MDAHTVRSRPAYALMSMALACALGVLPAAARAQTSPALPARASARRPTLPDSGAEGIPLRSRARAVLLGIPVAPDDLPPACPPGLGGVAQGRLRHLPRPGRQQGRSAHLQRHRQ